MRASIAAMIGMVSAGCGSTASAPADPVDAGADVGKVCGPPPGRYVEGQDPPAYCVREVTGRLTDSAGRNLSGITVSVCGGACFGATTDDSGVFTARPSARLPDNAYVLFAHARPRHGSLFVPMPVAPSERVDLGVLEVPVLDPVGAALPPDGAAATTVKAGAITLAIPAATTWELSFDDATDDVDGRILRTARVPLDRAPVFAKGAADVYALAPFEAKASNPIGVRIEGNAGLAPSTPVEIVVMGALSIEAPNTGGLPLVAAKGHVSADGASISTDPGEGLRTLTWIAVRAAR